MPPNRRKETSSGPTRSAEPVVTCKLHPRMRRIVISLIDFQHPHVPVIVQWTELLASLEAHLAAPAGLERVVAQGDNVVLDVT